MKRQGIPEDKIFLVGDVMVDSLLHNLDKARKSNILKELGLEKELSTDNFQLTTDLGVNRKRFEERLEKDKALDVIYEYDKQKYNPYERNNHCHHTC